MERELKRIEVKYLNALNELYKTLHQTSEIKINDFFRSQKVSNNLSRIMKGMNLIRSKKVGHTTFWFWTGEKPTIEMAVELTLKAQIDREKRKGNMNNKVEVKPVERPILVSKPIKSLPRPPKTTSNLQQLKIDYDVTSKTEKETVKISILWGLFTYIKK